MIRELGAQDILGLRRSDTVVVELLVPVGGRVPAVDLGVVLRVAAVKDALVVVGPRDPGELDLGEHLVIVLARRDLLEVDVEPVGAGLGEPVGEDAAVFAEGGGREAHGAVVREGVGVQEDLGLVVQRVLLVENAEGKRKNSQR